MKTKRNMQNNLNEHTYLTYCIDNEYYAIDVDQVINIIEYTKVTRVPKGPDYIKGIINISGEIIPVIDTMKILRLGELCISARICILILEYKMDKNLYKIGMLVDGVKDVIRLNDTELLKTSFLKTNKLIGFIMGIIKIQDELVMILDLNKLLNVREIIDFTFSQVENG
jgi:purine-binding chemotaxis protein CheW